MVFRYKIMCLTQTICFFLAVASPPPVVGNYDADMLNPPGGRSETSAQGICTLALTLIGFCVGIGIAYAIFRSNLGILSEAREPPAFFLDFQMLSNVRNGGLVSGCACYVSALWEGLHNG
eukprot:gnl/MRDRNA2_/MRDRNA2_267981_c0_seq1.p1 gnl/MRDRNA2_/MRDRNA2_267981_c0~~gnl/MRDRNA2_/MRDRNA2_267981_c0_seq1.p1  ORF type:complete len:120 (+),score=11.30 gnl/MRDRNA2_/MRDRNA2_267981_c0_seq1:127-486(+)